MGEDLIVIVLSPFLSNDPILNTQNDLSSHHLPLSGLTSEPLTATFHKSALSMTALIEEQSNFPFIGK